MSMLRVAWTLLVRRASSSAAVSQSYEIGKVSRSATFDLEKTSDVDEPADGGRATDYPTAPIVRCEGSENRAVRLS